MCELREYVVRNTCRGDVQTALDRFYQSMRVPLQRSNQSNQSFTRQGAVLLQSILWYILFDVASK